MAATFNPGDGSFIPIPDYLIPDSLKEWGQEPKCLEVLVSEDLHEDSDDHFHYDDFDDDDTDDENRHRHHHRHHHHPSSMTRITTTILPDTGCSVDNLEFIKAIDEVDLDSQWAATSGTKQPTNDDDDGNHNNSESTTTTTTTTTATTLSASNVIGLQYPIGNNNDELRLETIFGLKEEANEDGGTMIGQYRMRVAIDLIPSPPHTFAIQSPMLMTLERRTSSVSSGGTIGEWWWFRWTDCIDVVRRKIKKQ